MSDPFLELLLHSEHVRLSAGAGENTSAQEQQSLDRLLRHPKRTFLQEYDVLFRYVSLWVLDQGYVLTNYQPHRVLALVCEQFVARTQVQEMVRCRHALKYEGQPPTAAGIATLEALLEKLKRKQSQG